MPNIKHTPGHCRSGVSFYVLDVGIGLLVLSLVVAVIPEEFSRGSVFIKKTIDFQLQHSEMTIKQKNILCRCVFIKIKVILEGFCPVSMPYFNNNRVWNAPRQPTFQDAPCFYNYKLFNRSAMVCAAVKGLGRANLSYPARIAASFAPTWPWVSPLNTLDKRVGN